MNATSIELTVNVCGLCMFVPNERANSMHVLLPKTPIHAHHKHEAVLAYHPAYIDGGGDPTQNANPVYVSVDGLDLRIDGERADLPANFPREVVDLSEFAGSTVRSELLDEWPTMLRTRFTFSGGGFGSPWKGALWRLWKRAGLDQGEKQVRMSNLVPWKITVPADTPEIPGIEKLTLSLGTNELTLMTSDRKVDLYLLHLPHEEFADLEVPLVEPQQFKCPNETDKAPHFDSFLPLLSGAYDDAPRFVRESQKCLDTFPTGIIPVTCMTTGGQL